MGYTTDFQGSFTFDREVSEEHVNYINAFSETRRMQRAFLLAATLPDPKRIAALLPIGPDGGYFVGGAGAYGQDYDPSVLEYNTPPQGQPGLWCQWVIEENELQWNGGEKFYHYDEWLEYLIEHFFKPWGYVLNGKVAWQGEDINDRGTLILKDNVLTVKQLVEKEEEEEEEEEEEDWHKPKFATVSWTANDILDRRPDWTVEQAEDWLTENQEVIRDRMVQVGWDVIDTLLPEEE
jgi:hypothetical protein